MSDILKNDYKLPFPYTLSNAGFKNNSSALENSEFLEEWIKEKLREGTVRESLTKPEVLNPHSVPVKSKKRLILDPRYINNYLFKDKVKFDNWNSFSDLFGI